jgi:hypothetical protein
VFRHVLYASGATEQAEVREPLPRYRLSRKLIYAGLISLPLIVAADFCSSLGIRISGSVGPS